MKKIKKILIANRGEIALRIVRTCREMGIQTITLYTEEEKSLPHSFSGDEHFSLGSGDLKETYLNQEKIVKIAKELSADAIHPGYGFLSEKASFARLVEKNNLIFIGPTPESIELMGDKKSSKEKIVELGVPSIPGYHGSNQTPEYLLKEAIKIGFPVLIKASAGGGGKGMRIVHAEGEFVQNLEAAKREAMNAFSDDTVLLEKYITSPRHIEIQVMSDQHGHHFHLFERECSIQRRYQKIIEESPSPAVTPDLRKKMTEAALKITKGMNYRGAGTVELILDTDGSFYFLEMNTRLQVEHPVTEMVTGLDLVRLQIEVAEGGSLDLSHIKQNGHAIEARIYAEDPDNEFLPSGGKIHYIGRPSSVIGARLDCGYQDGNDMLLSFDPMCAKLIVWGESRTTAIKKLDTALNEVLFLGLKTNRDYIKRILSLKEFHNGETFTHFVVTYKEKLLKKELGPNEKIALIGAYLLASKNPVKENMSNAIGNTSDVWNNLTGFRNT